MSAELKLYPCRRVLAIVLGGWWWLEEEYAEVSLIIGKCGLVLAGPFSSVKKTGRFWQCKTNVSSVN